MNGMAILTPSYRPDLSLALDLHRSILRHTEDDVIHHIIVPEIDTQLFASHATARMQVHSVRRFLPTRYLSTYAAMRGLGRWRPLGRIAKIQAINVCCPWMPVRGWMLQQVVKLAAASALDADVTVIIDSDAALIRHLGVADVMRDGAVRLYRLQGGVHSGMPQHIAWHSTADRLLGVNSPVPPLPDYISPFVAWDPCILRDLQRRITAVTGKDWLDAITGLSTFSECILYGRFVDQCSGALARTFVESQTRCLTYWEDKALMHGDIETFLDRLTGAEFVLNLQSVSCTSRDVRQAAILQAELRAAAS